MSEARPNGEQPGERRSPDRESGGTPQADRPYRNGRSPHGEGLRDQPRAEPRDESRDEPRVEPRAERVEERPPSGFQARIQSIDRRYTPAAVITLLVLVLLLLLAWLLNGAGMITLPGTGARVVPTPQLILNQTTEPAILGGAAASDIPPVGLPPGPPPPVDERFAAAYAARGGLPILGLPLAPASEVNGRLVQWFERGRLEQWPEFAGTPYEVQLGLVGTEFTQGRAFPSQSFFVSRPELRFFPETGHGVGGLFLRFYDANGGLDVFGYPISDEFDETLPDGRTYRVQYFQRARMEYHPEFAGTPNEVQLGLLGTALFRNDARPATIPPAPTPVP